jgi:hypothetical protein
LWGLGAFGQPGVERVLAILRAETRAAMQQIGAPALKDLTPDMVRRVWLLCRAAQGWPNNQDGAALDWRTYPQHIHSPKTENLSDRKGLAVLHEFTLQLRN